MKWRILFEVDDPALIATLVQASAGSKGVAFISAQPVEAPPSEKTGKRAPRGPAPHLALNGALRRRTIKAVLAHFAQLNLESGTAATAHYTDLNNGFEAAGLNAGSVMPAISILCRLGLLKKCAQGTYTLTDHGRSFLLSPQGQRTLATKE